MSVRTRVHERAAFGSLSPPPGSRDRCPSPGSWTTLALVSDPRVMTVEEANALVPKLAAIVGRQLLRASEIEDRLKRLANAGQQARPRPGGPAIDLEVAVGDSDEVRALKLDLLERVAAYEEGWREVQGLGAVIKDPRVGLCDFYGRIEGKLVWLCWRFGEEAIEFYHDLDAGFSGRKPLSKATRQRMLN